jgi:hypothetical protein
MAIDHRQRYINDSHQSYPKVIVIAVKIGTKVGTRTHKNLSVRTCAFVFEFVTAELNKNDNDAFSSLIGNPFSLLSIIPILQKIHRTSLQCRNPCLLQSSSFFSDL